MKGLSFLERREDCKDGDYKETREDLETMGALILHVPPQDRPQACSFIGKVFGYPGPPPAFRDGQEANLLWEPWALTRFNHRESKWRQGWCTTGKYKTPEEVRPWSKRCFSVAAGPFSYLYKESACLRNEALPKCKVHKKPCQKLEGLWDEVWFLCHWTPTLDFLWAWHTSAERGPTGKFYDLYGRNMN